MNIDEILDMMDDMLDRAWNLPLTGGRSVMDSDKLREMIDDIRLNLPGEIKQAKSIVADRAEILASAKREAESIVRKAEERARALVSQEEIVKESQARATEIMSMAQGKAREMKQASHDFSDNMLRQTEEALVKSLSEVKVTRQALRSAGKNT